MDQSGYSQPLGVWQEVQSSDHVGSTVGKTGQRKTCCCDHSGCDAFRGESWCERLFVIMVYAQDAQRGQPRDVSAGETAAKASLSSRSYRDYRFEVEDIITGSMTQVRLVVLLAKGESPLTTEEVEYWNTDASCVDVLRGTCCVPRSYEAVSGMLHLYCHHSGESLNGVDDLSSQNLVYDLMRSCAGTNLGEREIVREIIGGDCPSCG